MDERDDEVRAVKHARHGLQLRAAEEAGHVERARQAEAELAEWAKARQDAANWKTTEERAADERARLYGVLKARDALDVYYQMYPDVRPKRMQARDEAARDGRDRER